MIYRIILAFIFSTFVLAANAEPTNLVVYKSELKRYHDEGHYEQEVATVVQKAMRYLSNKISSYHQQSSDKKLAIVFDIDETTLSNYKNMEKMDFGGTLADIDKNIAKGEDPALLPTLQLYQFAKEHHVAVFFVTGRHANIRKSTIANLKKAGYLHWQGLYFKPEHYHKPSVIPYKAEARRKIAEQGYEIVESIGDQQSDLRGGYADATFKLPNPYYFIP